MWLILRKHTESIFRVSGERKEEGCFIMQEGRDPLSQYRCVFIIGTRLTLPLQLCALPHTLNTHVPSVEKSHTAIVAEATLLCTQYLVSWHNSDFWCHSDSLCPISNTGRKQCRTERDGHCLSFSCPAACPLGVGAADHDSC